jgi:hypothetical protein
LDWDVALNTSVYCFTSALRSRISPILVYLHHVVTFVFFWLLFVYLNLVSLFLT